MPYAILVNFALPVSFTFTNRKKENMENQNLNLIPSDSNLNFKRVLTLEEASIYSGISLSYLYKLTSAKKIRHSKPMGKLIFIERAVLEEWLLQNSIQTESEVLERARQFKVTQKK